MSSNIVMYTSLNHLIKTYYLIYAVDAHDNIFFLELNKRNKFCWVDETKHYNSNGKRSAIFKTKKDAEFIVSQIKKSDTNFVNIYIDKGIPSKNIDNGYLYLEG